MKREKQPDRRRAGDIIVTVLTIVAFILIAAYTVLRIVNSAGAFADALQNKWVIAFLAALVLVTMIIYVIFRNKERGGRWTVLSHSVTAAGGILLIAGFILMCMGII